MLLTVQIVARCEPSVALIKGSVSSGTGFVIRRGIVATNAHVIEEELLSRGSRFDSQGLEGRQGPLPAQLLYEDRKRDRAFLVGADRFASACSCAELHVLERRGRDGHWQPWSG